MVDYLIIGNGVAGQKAAETIRQNDNDGSVAIVSNEDCYFYYRPQLPKFIAGKVKERALFAKTKSFYEGNNIDLKLGAKAKKIIPDKNQVELDNGETIEYGKLLLTPGGKLISKNYPGSDKTDDVIGLKTFNDANNIKEKLKDVKNAVVIGDSFLATFLTEAFNEHGVSVTYIIRNDRLFPELIDVDASKLLELRFQLKGINLVKGTDIKDISVRNGSVYGLNTTDGKFIDCQLIGIADGLEPDIQFLTDSGINLDEGILVDGSMKTNVPNIFAAGDATQLGTGDKSMPQINVRWLKAWKQGIVAGRNMTGANENYDEFDCFASTQIYGVDMVSIGISNPTNGKYKIMRGDYPHPDIDVYKKLVLEDETIVGALLVGSVHEATALAKAISGKKKVSEVDQTLIKQLFDLHYVTTPHRGVICPVCKLQMSLGPNVKPGDTVTCPACGIEIKVK